MQKLTFTPSPAIDGKYEVINCIHPILYSKIGKIDFRDITEELAEQLIASGTDYLRPVDKTRKKDTQK